MPKLEKFKKETDKPTVKQIYISAGIIVGLLGIFVAYKSFALYTDKKTNDVIKAKIGDYRKDTFVSYDNTNTGLNCSNTKCAIDAIADMLGE